MKRSAISWTDFSGGNLNFVLRGKRGDCECSVGCQHCYALRIGERFGNLPEKTTIYPEKLQRLRTQRFPQEGNVRGPGKRPMAFVCGTGDLFHNEVPEEFILEALDVMVERGDVVWQVLTKRAKRMQALTVRWIQKERCGLPSNVWLVVSASDQSSFDERVEWLNRTPAIVCGVSLEPLLGPVTLGDHLQLLSWVVVGGESGPQHRPLERKWVEDLYQQCREADVPCYIKQDSAFYPGKPLLVGGREIHEWPEAP